MHEKIFDDIGKTLKLIAQICFYLCLCVGLLYILIGAFRFLGGIDEYTTFSEGLSCTLEDALEYKSLYGDCYYGRQMIKTGFILMLCSLSSLPLFGFGELVDSNLEIKRTLRKTKTD